MKKIFAAAVALIFTACIVQAQESQPKKAEPTKAKTVTAKPAAAKCDMKNCCMMKEGKMICMKDGKEMPMESDMRMGDGSLVTKDGTCIGKDGKKRMMKDGECIDMSGKTCMMPMSKKAETPKPVDSSAPAKPADAK